MNRNQASPTQARGEVTLSRGLGLFTVTMIGIGGMIGATSLALFFVPLFYYLIVSTREKMTGGRATGNDSPATSETKDA